MGPTIATMWAAVLWITKNEARIIEALASQAQEQGRAADDDVAVERLAVLSNTAEFLAKLYIHEASIRRLMKEGTLADFPVFSANTTAIKTGDTVLMRAKLVELNLDECIVRIEAERLSHSIPIYRVAIVGVEKTSR